MAIYPKVNGAYKKPTALRVKVDGFWRKGKTAYLKVNGAWKKCYNSSTIFVYDEYTYFEIPIEGYDGTAAKKVTIKNAKFRLYNKTTNALLGSKEFGDITVTETYRPSLGLNLSTTQSGYATPHISNSEIILYCSVTDGCYVEFEFDGMVKAS